MAAVPNLDAHTGFPGLYIHVPFCISKCPYCGFYSITDLSLIRKYLSALRLEMDLVNNPPELFDTVYIGGGTPSVLSSRQIEELLYSVHDFFRIAGHAEATIEMNPADTTSNLLRAVWRGGINRLSIGVQSFNDAVLSFLGRRHRSAEAIAAIEAGRKAGFDNISIDLIYGIPGQDTRSWLETLKQAVALKPDHLSCYELTVENPTPFGRDVRTGHIVLPDETVKTTLFFRTAEFLEKHGYRQYEVSNFARPGRESRHNQKYWEHVPYLGLGPSAHSFSGYERRWNVRSVHSYIEQLECGILPLEGREMLDLEEIRTETLFLGLRTTNGIPLGDFRSRFGSDLLKEKRGIIDFLAANGFLTIHDGALLPTRKGLAVADSLALAL